MNRAKDAMLVLCLFIVYCVLLSQGLKASAVSAFFGRSQPCCLPCTCIAGCGHRRRRETVGSVTGAKSSDATLLKQSQIAFRREPMDVSGTRTSPVAWSAGPPDLRPSGD